MFNNALDKVKENEKPSNDDEESEDDIPKSIYDRPLTFCSLFGELEENLIEQSTPLKNDNRIDSNKKTMEKASDKSTLPLSSNPLDSDHQETVEDAEKKETGPFKLTKSNRENRRRKPKNSRYAEKVHQDTKESNLLTSGTQGGLKRRIKSRPREKKEAIDIEPKVNTPECMQEYSHYLVKEKEEENVEMMILDNLPLGEKKGKRGLEMIEIRALNKMAINLTESPTVGTCKNVAEKPFDPVGDSTIPSIGGTQQKRKIKPRMKTKKEEPKSKSARHDSDKDTQNYRQTSKSTKIIGDISDSDSEDNKPGKDDDNPLIKELKAKLGMSSCKVTSTKSTHHDSSKAVHKVEEEKKLGELIPEKIEKKKSSVSIGRA